MTAPFESRIREIVERLSAATGDLSALAGDRRPPAPAAGSAPMPADMRPTPSYADQAATLLDHRRLRSRFLPAGLFGEPGWDMLVAVYVADRRGRAVNVKALVTMVDAPATTSQRWIDHLDRLGLVKRTSDPLDRRRTEVSLTGAGQAAIEAYLRAIRPA